MVQNMNRNDLVNSAGGWVSQAMRPVREENDGQFDDCDESLEDNALNAAHEKIGMISRKTPMNIACSDSTDGVSAFDVLSGRGGGTNNHPGNQYFRSLCDQCRPKYVLARKMEKREIARNIVATVRSRGGRFLKKDEKTGNWYDIGDTKATSKTSQALREGLASKMRQALMSSDAPKMAQAMMASVESHNFPILSAQFSTEEREMPPLPPLPHDEPSSRIQDDQLPRSHSLDDPSTEYEQDSKRQRVSSI